MWYWILMRIKRNLFKKFKAPIANRYAKPKMTKEADDFLEHYAEELHLELCESLDFTKGFSEHLTMKEHLEKISPFIHQISMRQKERWHFLPIQVMIYLITKKLKPDISVETGVEKGGSTYMMLKAIQENKKGHLYSIDIEQYYKYKGRYVSQIAPLVREDLKDRWTFICGDAQKETSKLLTKTFTGKVSLFLAGQSHTYEIQKQEGELAWKHLASGGIFILDRPDFNDNKYLNEFKSNHHDEIDFIQIYKEGRTIDTLEFAVTLKK